MSNSSLIDRIDVLIRFFLYILIFWLPYSPAVIESCVIISFILWLVKRGVVLAQRKPGLKALKDIKAEPTFLNTPIIFFLFACILSAISSAFFAQSLQNFITKTLEWFVIYFLIVEVFKEKKHIYIALAIFAFTAFSTVLDSFVQFYVTNKDIFLGHVIEPGSRATAGFKTANSLGGYLTGFIPICAAWIFLGRQKRAYRLWGVIMILLSIWSLGITFSRGAWIGTISGVMFLALYVLFSGKRWQFYLSLGVLCGIMALCISLVVILAKSSGQELLSRYQTIPWRLDIWNISMEMIKDKPLFGHGINTYMGVFQAYRGNNMMGPTYAHNCYIQLAAETGLVGLLCFLWIMVKLFHQSLGRIKICLVQDRNLAAIAIGLLSGISAFLVHSFFDTNFYSLQLSVYLWFMIGMLVAVCGISDKREEA